MTPEISKDKITPEFLLTLRNSGVKEMLQLADTLEASIKPKGNAFLDQFITCHPDMIKMKEHIRILMDDSIDDPVLIIGESGTGKELIANALHNGREGQFVAINCAGMPEQLIESELFGHVKGAFTGADKDKKGLFEEAADGTLFLDEIGEMPMLMQAKLLRAIQERKIRRVGGNVDIKISTRIVSATHRRIDEDVHGEHFRRDLFWRISTFILRPLPLSMRIDDIPLILKSLELPDKPIPPICLFNEHLTGNIRSLQQIVKRYYILGELP